ncbi:MAG: bifunctional phosphopantothenoylcysteine decarboxylase/phosphopantothenate--cysteine ligase CoaBC [Agarilytica sp.]
MQTLTNKRVLLGVTGGIAAYKSADLVRRLQDSGADVRVVMTKASQEFITPLTMQALSGNAVHTDLLNPQAEAAMGHIELSRWADVVLVAPASANFISRLAAGEGSDLLSTLCLATDAPLALAPAMNQGMWHSAATQENIVTLRGRGTHLFGPDSGGQACGDVGPGRMLEPIALVQACAQIFDSGALAGKHVMITAGPTREAIDPVRYISNHSSGKMGYALAKAAVDAGAKVTLISGPVALPCPDRVTRIEVESAQQMQSETLQRIQREDCDIFIGAAAVADYRCRDIAQEKMKKDGSDSMCIELVKNPDIIASVAALERKPYTVGFAAETHQVVEYAKTKRNAKNLDLIIANDVSEAGIGFNSEDNAVTVIGERKEQSISVRSKDKLARELITIIAQAYSA